MRCSLFLVVLFWFGVLSASDGVRVYLQTDTPLQPLYLAQIDCHDHSLSPRYLSQLQAILHFDFQHNGKNQLSPAQEETERWLRSPNCFSGGKREALKFGALCFVKPVIYENRLCASVLSVPNYLVQQFSLPKLSGVLSQDRHILHQLADQIFQFLYREEGIATSRILYSVKFPSNHRWVSEVWSCDWDGGNPRQCTQENNYCVTPVPIPKSDRFLYVSYRSGQPKIVLFTPAEGGSKRVVDLRGNQLLPAISQKRDKIAFISDVTGTADLFLQEFDPQKGKVGKPMQLFAYPRSTQASPSFSPDGSKIAFVSDKDGSPKIYLIPAIGSPNRAIPTLISKQNRENSCPAWSPDGKKLAYSAKTKGIRQIWIYDFVTQTEWQLTDGKGNKENPSWARNSQHLVFNSIDGNLSELYLVNLNQRDVVKITSGAGVKHYPAWNTK